MSGLYTYEHPLLPEGVIIEMIPIGAYIKVSAIDPCTGTEIAIVGSRIAPSEYLRSTAIQKLLRILGDTPRKKYPSHKNHHKSKKLSTSQRADKALSRDIRRKNYPSGWDV